MAKVSIRAGCAVLVFLLLGGCAVIDVNHSAPLDPSQRFMLLPIENYSEMPQAGEKIEALLTTMLRARRLPVEIYPPKFEDGLPDLDESRRFHRGLDGARASGAKYGVTGSVIEWRYKSGLDGDPAVSVTLRVVDIKSGAVVWSASGSRSGWGGDSLGGVAQVLLRELVARMNFTYPPDRK